MKIDEVYPNYFKCPCCGRFFDSKIKVEHHYEDVHKGIFG